MKPNYFIIPLITIATSITGSFFTTSGMDWYKTITLPSWTPAGSVIGTVWTILFILISISVLLVWNKTKHDKKFKDIISFFIINAILNLGWSILFFGMHQIFLAFIEALILASSILVLIILIWPKSKTASLLLWPYLGWVLFASYLNWNIYILN